ncbi:GSCOCG00010466001-RA-CDS [Cotesia congregata]|nr:GSCOCG00010466001-RA-CDS [Cotesia congregata]
MVDLSGYVIILINDNGKIKLYGSSADNAEYPEVSDEILEVNGRTLENATDTEVSQHIHQCIRSGTISLQVTRRAGHKMKLDGPNADKIRDAWVIALERGARERLQKLPALKKVKPRDIQAILHQQINEEKSASTSKIETPINKDSNSPNNHITVTLADGQTVNRTPPSKLSNGTVPKSISNDDNEVLISKDDHYSNKEVLEKQRNYSDEPKLLHPSVTSKLGERRSSSPFQNGRTEVLIGEPEGGPRSPRGSTSSAINDFLSTDNPEPICRSRRRSATSVNDIQLQNNNNSPSLRESKDSRSPHIPPDEMWVPGVTPGHHRELPVDVPDTLLQQAYANNKESNVDIDDDYPFAKEDYPTMLKTCSDDSASPRSSSGRSDSTTALDTSLIIPGKESPLYDARRIDLGSPCRTIPDLSIYGMTRETTSFDNPAYGLDLHQGLLIRSDEVLDLRIIGDNCKNCEIIPIGKPEKSLGKKKKPKNTSSFDVDLIAAKSTDDLLAADLTGFVARTSIKKPPKKSNLPVLPTPPPLPPQVPTINGYSTLRNDSHKSSSRGFREVAVDCPPDFIPVTKSHPIYPPPNKLEAKNKNSDSKVLTDRSKSKESVVAYNNNNNHSFNNNHCNSNDNNYNNKSVNDGIQRDVEAVDSHQDHKGNGVKPLLPPRDQKRAPARPPKDNLRLSTRNSTINDNNDNTISQPTPQQLQTIQKYKEQLRQRKDFEERREFLNQSLRGSQKLHALESHAKQLAGQENPAYSQDEVTNTTGNVRKEKEQTSGQASPKVAADELPAEDPKILSYGEVVATLERLQLQLRNLSGALGISGPGVEAELEAVRSLVQQRRFATALATHNFIKTKLHTGKLHKAYNDDASNLARDCVELFEECQTTQTVKSPETLAIIEELTGLLTSYDMEGLLFAHDSIISYCDGIQLKDGPLSSSASEQSLSRHSSLRDSLRNTDNIKIIKIEKTNEPLGATVRNEGDAVIIGRVVRGGAADKSGLFNEGDEVLEVNGVEMRGKSVNEVCDILASMQGSLTFIVLPASAVVRSNSDSSRLEDNNLIHHVRAHFDYDPEEDPYIPCRELGISFQKGDVLHVISQDDSNWWQAYREGEEDQTLAGLIPSQAFQHQRESMKQTITGGKTTLRSSKKSSTLLCTRKNPKKKKKRAKFGGSINDDGYPSYSTTTIDDYDSEEVLTYEEVALYYPRASHKRPIVLIGPPNIGRHELRQRLMQDSERFAAAIPHTSRPRKGSEVDGQDYHFITRQQFETDIVGRKFVEHGEYEKAYYGTSIEAIRSVVNSGKICVLNLHPQSLKILRNSDLKPYVVFVAPPSLEKLRQKRIKNNENYKEDELKDIIEKARDMEDKYGHLFDMIIINNDTDRAYNQLLTEINSLEREPQWVPATWVQ